jgi:hypothetical protein
MSDPFREKSPASRLLHKGNALTGDQSRPAILCLVLKAAGLAGEETMLRDNELLRC